MSKDNLTLLKERADKLGLKYSPNIGAATLQERVNEATIALSEKPKEQVTLAENEAQRLMRKKKEAEALVRVQVTCSDPTMKKRKGTYIMGSNNLVGTIRKFIEFNKPWMMPRMLVNVMKESKYQAWVEGDTKFGITQMVSSMENRYAITELPPITPKELEIIRERQSITQSLKD